MCRSYSLDRGFFLLALWRSRQALSCFPRRDGRQSALSLTLHWLDRPTPISRTAALLAAFFSPHSLSPAPPPFCRTHTSPLIAQCDPRAWEREREREEEERRIHAFSTNGAFTPHHPFHDDGAGGIGTLSLLFFLTSSTSQTAHPASSAKARQANLHLHLHSRTPSIHPRLRPPIMSSEEGFRLRTKDDPIGSISIPKLIRSSVRHGEFQFMFLVPHFVLPAYGIYRLAHSQGIYPAHLEPLAEVVLAVVQGVAVGGLITFGWLRFSAAGRRLQGRIEAGAATPGEAKAQKKMQLGFALCAYVLFAT